jgi:hypothetical protein
MDESALFYNVQPNRIVAITGETYLRKRTYKHRWTMLLCCNSEESKKSKPPGSFKNHGTYKSSVCMYIKLAKI